MVPNLMNKVRTGTRVKRVDGVLGEVVHVSFGGADMYPVTVKFPDGQNTYTREGCLYANGACMLDLVDVIGDKVEGARDDEPKYKQDPYLDSLEYFRKKMGV